MISKRILPYIYAVLALMIVFVAVLSVQNASAEQEMTMDPEIADVVESMEQQGEESRNQISGVQQTEKFLSTPECEPMKWKKFTHNNHRKILLDEIKAMYNSHNYVTKIFADSRVLDSKSEFYKDNGKDASVTEEDVSSFDIKTQRKTDDITQCYEEAIQEKNSKYYEAEVTVLEDYNKASSSQFNFDSYIDDWINRLEQIDKYMQEKEELNNIFKERLKLFSHTYLAFTYAPEIAKKKKYMDHFDAFVKNELSKRKALHFVNKKINLEGDDFASEFFSEYKVKVQTSTSDGISFKPSTDRRAQIQKYRLVEVDYPMQTGREITETEFPEGFFEYTKTEIFLGIDDVQLKEKRTSGPGNEVKYSCTNCGELQNSYSKIKKVADAAGINIKNQKNKIEEYIYEVISENAKMVQRYHDLRREYMKKISEKNELIDKNILKIQEIENKLRGDGYSLPSLPVNLARKDDIKADIETIRNNFSIELNDIRRDMVNHRRHKSNIIYSVLDKTEEIDMKQIKEHINEKYIDLTRNSCPSLHTGSTAFYNDIVKENKNETKFYAKITEFNIPVFRIKAIDESDSDHYSIGIALKVECEDMKIAFDYNPEENIIVDAITKIQWDSVSGKIAKRRASGDSVFKLPKFSEYYDFCISYNQFLENNPNSPIFSEWPELECVEHFKYVAEENTIIDYDRREKWKIVSDINFANLNAKVSGSKWRIASFGKTRRLLNDLCDEELAQEWVVKVIPNREFWTSSSVGKNKIMTVIDDGNEILDNTLSTNSNVAYGLIYTEF